MRYLAGQLHDFQSWTPVSLHPWLPRMNSPPGSAQTDREMLLSVYRTTGGESWKRRDGWEENTNDLSRWFGVSVNGKGRVVKLELQGKISQGLQNEQKGEGNNLCGKSRRHSQCCYSTL